MNWRRALGLTSICSKLGSLACVGNTQQACRAGTSVPPIQNADSRQPGNRWAIHSAGGFQRSRPSHTGGRTTSRCVPDAN